MGAILRRVPLSEMIISVNRNPCILNLQNPVTFPPHTHTGLAGINPKSQFGPRKVTVTKSHWELYPMGNIFCEIEWQKTLPLKIGSSSSVRMRPGLCGFTWVGYGYTVVATWRKFDHHNSFPRHAVLADCFIHAHILAIYHTLGHTD